MLCRQLQSNLKRLDRTGSANTQLQRTLTTRHAASLQAELEAKDAQIEYLSVGMST